MQACPYADYEVLSLGVFVEHDTAEPLVCASADVFHVPNDLTTDLGYGISAAKMARLPLKNLAVTVGIALREYQYIGYFGMDVVTLTNEDAVSFFFLLIYLSTVYAFISRTQALFVLTRSYRD